MINSHLHIWDSVWADEYNSHLKQSESNNKENDKSKSTIIVDNNNKSNKRGKN